jgi:hypothetical protein
MIKSKRWVSAAAVSLALSCGPTDPAPQDSTADGTPDSSQDAPDFGAATTSTAYPYSITQKLRGKASTTNIQTKIEALLNAVDGKTIGSGTALAVANVTQKTTLNENEVLAFGADISFSNLVDRISRDHVTKKYNLLMSTLGFSLRTPQYVRFAIEQEGTTAPTMVMTVNISNTQKDLSLLGGAHATFTKIDVKLIFDTDGNYTVGFEGYGWARASARDRWLRLNPAILPLKTTGELEFGGKFPGACDYQDTTCTQEWDVLNKGLISVASGEAKITYADGAVDGVEYNFVNGKFGPSGNSFTISEGAYGVSRDEVTIKLVPANGALVDSIRSMFGGIVRKAVPSSLAQSVVDGFVTKALSGFEVSLIDIHANPTSGSFETCDVTVKVLGQNVAVSGCFANREERVARPGRRVQQVSRY